PSSRSSISFDTFWGEFADYCAWYDNVKVESTHHCEIWVPAAFLVSIILTALTHRRVFQKSGKDAYPLHRHVLDGRDLLDGADAPRSEGRSTAMIPPMLPRSASAFAGRRIPTSSPISSSLSTT